MHRAHGARGGRVRRIVKQWHSIEILAGADHGQHLLAPVGGRARETDAAAADEEQPRRLLALEHYMLAWAIFTALNLARDIRQCLLVQRGEKRDVVEFARWYHRVDLTFDARSVFFCRCQG